MLSSRRVVYAVARNEVFVTSSILYTVLVPHLESDTEGDATDSYSLMRMRRKSSGASSKGSTNVGRNALTANLKELSRRSSMHLRKLTAKMGSN
ncbi:hypothetical protein GGH13_009563 [Coemansia sp. S155-1]|nr:hypothetical protein GGH13_009563 [Coemansia sp. S155-1]